MAAAFQAFAPPPELTISQWADRERYLSPESSSEPGKWHTSRVPYMRELMDVVGDPSIKKVVCMKASQVAWTEALNNTAGYYIDQDPCPILLIQPTLDLAEVWSKDRLAPMLRDTPALQGKVHDPRARDSGNTIKQKVFPGGRLAIIGANAPSQLASRPIRVVLADEIDRYPVSASTEGDPLKLAEKRQTTFWNRKTLLGSTPLKKGESVIEREWLASDQRRYFVPCHACGGLQFLKWSNVKWDKSPEGAHMANTAYYLCEHCGAVWDDVDRWDACGHGKWVAQAPENKGVAGFHIPGMLSPWLTLFDIVTEFLAARKDPQLLQVWTNTVLGDVWEEAAEKVEAAGLIARAEVYSHDAAPEGVRLVTAGVDVQGNRLEVQIDGWGVGEECWRLRYEVLHGDPAQQSVWDDLDRLLLERLRTEDGRMLRVRACCVDTGGHHANAVFTFCNKRRGRHVFPIKGIAGPRPVWPKRASKTKDKRNEVFLVGVDTAKDTIYGRLRNTKVGPAYIHFPVDGSTEADADGGFSAEYYAQLTSEKVVTRFKEGRPYRVWTLPDGVRNEALDVSVYSMAARASIPIRLVGALPPLPAKPPADTPPGGVPPAEAPEPQDDPPQGSRQKAPRNAKPALARPRGRVRRVSRSNYMG